MIQLKNLTKNYGGTTALKEVSITIEAGDKIAIVGESGCGKTTMLHLIAGIMKATKGEVLIHEKPITHSRQGTAIILQQEGLFPWKNVYNNVALALLNRGLSSDDVKKKVLAILRELGLGGLESKYIHELSGGQKQRVAIGRALVQNPDILLMDEPTGSLDMLSKERFQDTLHQLNDGHHFTSIIVTHDIEEAVFLGKRILVMKKGELVESLNNPYYGMGNIREELCFYELCLKVRQVMKS